MNAHQQIIEEFYAAFAANRPETMASCYHPDVVFHDPAFGTLHGNDAVDMWHMLLERSKGNLAVTFSGVWANDKTGRADWVAVYPFSKTGRTVTNRIHAEFEFEDGLIISHHDDFDLWNWSRQAFGITGLLLGWTPFFAKKVRQQAVQALHQYQSRRN